MSDFLYSSRLRWSGGRGAALLHGRRVELREAPYLGNGSPVHALDYTPEVAVYRIQRTPHAGWDDMTPDEIHAADELLQRLINPVTLDDPDDLRPHTHREHS